MPRDRHLLRGVFSTDQVKEVISRNVREYVICSSCRFADTRLTREKRLLLVECNGCGTKTSVKEIVVGFRADTSRRRDR